MGNVEDSLDKELKPLSDRVKLSQEEWRKRLSAEEFEVTRQGGTEAAFTGAYWDCKDPGLYRCTCCDAPLYRSETKYDSGSGWPSFWEPVSEDAVYFVEDRSLGMRRTEVRCATCDAHLGHVFKDGPEPTGLRHCINSVSLKLDKEETGEKR